MPFSSWLRDLLYTALADPGSLHCWGTWLLSSLRLLSVLPCPGVTYLIHLDS